MIGPRLGVVRVDPCNPRIKITLGWGCNTDAGLINLYMRRAGSPADFAVYPPLSVNGGELVFQFDDLLWVQAQGRFEGKLIIGAREIRRLQFEYRTVTDVISMENPSV